MPSCIETAESRQADAMCIILYSRSNTAGDMLMNLLKTRQLCAISTLHQPRRGTTNKTYLSKDPRYGPSQIDYIGIVPMDVISLQKLCEMGCYLPTLGQTL